ncbi:MAG: hypothetical protein H6R02_302, partial [Burkholderiaceae bacterium]|nr:hypothetical protein [Burkholderiaceae bacterium]
MPVTALSFAGRPRAPGLRPASICHRTPLPNRPDSGHAPHLADAHSFFRTTLSSSMPRPTQKWSTHERLR